MQSGYVLVLERLCPLLVDFVELRNEFLESGFRLVASRDLKLRRDLSNPSDGLVKYIQMLTSYERTEHEVRAAIDDVFDQPNMAFCLKKLAIFAK